LLLSQIQLLLHLEELFTLLEAHDILNGIRILLQVCQDFIPINTLELRLLCFDRLLVLLDPFSNRSGFAFQLVLLLLAFLDHVFVVLVLLIQISFKLSVHFTLF